MLGNWKQVSGRGEDPHAWPEDGLCLCKENFLSHIQCCEENAPFDLADLKKDAGTNYLLKRSCCNLTLTGVRCGECARYYTWTRGVVSTHQVE